MKNIHYKRCRLSGFTLIELLVVISIIALLVSILMPALGKARMQAQKVVCQAHLHGCSQSAILYAEDNDGKYPPCNMLIASGSGSYAIWVRSRMNNVYSGYQGHGILVNTGYVEDPELFYCPANKNETLRYGQPDPTSPGGGWPLSGKVPEDMPASQSWVQSTYHYRSLWDGAKWRSVNFAKDSGVGVMADVFSDPTRGVDYHHKDGYNINYVDGHVNYINEVDGEIDSVIMNMNNGNRYHVNHALQDSVWKEYFDESRKYPLVTPLPRE